MADRWATKRAALERLARDPGATPDERARAAEKLQQWRQRGNTAPRRRGPATWQGAWTAPTIELTIMKMLDDYRARFPFLDWSAMFGHKKTNTQGGQQSWDETPGGLEFWENPIIPWKKAKINGPGGWRRIDYGRSYLKFN